MLDHLSNVRVLEAEHTTLFDIGEEFGVAPPIDDRLQLCPSFILTKVLPELIQIRFVRDDMLWCLLQIMHDASQQPNPC